MKKFIIKGPNKAVKGEVDISGAKNSCLPLMAASILFHVSITGPYKFRHVRHLQTRRCVVPKQDMV